MAQDTNSTRRTQSEAWLKLQALDLSAIKLKLTHPDEGEGWTEQRADRVESSYRQFLFLNLKYPAKKVVPTKEVDTFWHYHILDTRKYFADCDFIFGFYLHHFPYFGMRGEEDAAALVAAFRESQELSLQEFGLNADGEDPESEPNPATCLVHDPDPQKRPPATCVHEPDRKQGEPATCLVHKPDPDEKTPATCLHPAPSSAISRV